tara:strand:+ start:9504 stop:10094 length:591 start_codon:yes stop_codon:yes gene_type:complete
MSHRLAWATPPEWVAMVEADPLAFLNDHAHCELKAAAMGQSLIAKNPSFGMLIDTVPQVVLEEMQHFVQVNAELRKRGGELGVQEPSPYADGLHQGAAATRTSLVLDRLVLAHLIEARSLERFDLLANHLTDRTLAALYEELLPSEAAHRGLFRKLAREAYGDAAEARIETLGELESRLIAGLPFAHRVHSGIRVR